MQYLAGGLAGVRQTLSHMRRFVTEARIDPVIRNTASQLVADLPQKDYAGEARALFDFVKYRIRYTRDTNGVELVQTPRETLRRAQGDCDDKSTLLAALLESIGFKTRFHAMGFRPGHVCHVSVAALVHGKWVNLDTTEPQPMGWIPPSITESLYNETGMGELDGILQKIWGGVKKVGRTFDDKLLQKVTKPFKPLVRQKWFGQLGSVVSFIPGVGTAIGAGMVLANKAATITDADSRMRKIMNMQNAEQRAAFLATYGYNEETGQFYPVNPATYTGQKFKLDPDTNQIFAVDDKGNPMDFDPATGKTSYPAGSPQAMKKPVYVVSAVMVGLALVYIAKKRKRRR